MRRAAAAAVVVAVACAVGACGGHESAGAPRGNPDGRHGAAAVDAYASVELLRALLIASSDSYYAGASADDARRQLARARAAYNALAPRVRAKDGVVDREVVARFDVLARDIRRRMAPDHYRDLAGPLTDQLMDGVSQALVPEAASLDRGVQAEALRRVTARLAATYDAAAMGTGADARAARLAFEESWGLWRRALALTALIKPNLGSQGNTVAASLSDLRGTAFKDGPTMPAALPAAKVATTGTKVIDALTKRFGLEPL
jgi:hypothetical protein